MTKSKIKKNIVYKKGVITDGFGKTEFGELKIEEDHPIMFCCYKVNKYWRYGYKTVGIIDVIKYKLSKLFNL